MERRGGVSSTQPPHLPHTKRLSVKQPYQARLRPLGKEDSHGNVSQQETLNRCENEALDISSLVDAADMIVTAAEARLLP